MHYFSHNGSVLPTEQATIPLSNIEYSYGFGVYETVRVSDGVAYFLDDHIERLMESARIIGIEHLFTSENIATNTKELVARNEVDACNVKILLIGAKTAKEADLYIQCLNPLFPDRKLYKTGAHFITYNYERPFSHAKSLNMLSSYLAYREAKQASAYDALLVDRLGNILEGTRTNFFCIKDKTIFSPPEDQILLGVMRKAVLKVARENGFDVTESNIALQDLDQFDGAFVTSTSSKIMPARSIDDYTFGEPSPQTKDLMNLLQDFLKSCNGKF